MSKNTLISLERRRLPLYPLPPTIPDRNPVLYCQRYRSLSAQRTLSKQARFLALTSSGTQHPLLLGIRVLRLCATLPAPCLSIVAFGTSLTITVLLSRAPIEVFHAGLGCQYAGEIYAFTARCAGMGRTGYRRGGWFNEATEGVACGKRLQAGRDGSPVAYHDIM